MFLWPAVYSSLFFLPNKKGGKTKSVLLKFRFINRDGIDFSDAQSMQPIQVLPDLSLSESLDIIFKTYMKHLFVLPQGVGFGWEFARNARIPDTVIFLIFNSSWRNKMLLVMNRLFWSIWNFFSSHCCQWY